MKGVIFNIVEDVVVDAHGADMWDDLLNSAGLDGAYTSLGSYDDEDLMRLVAAASAAMALPANDVLQWLGRRAIPLMAKRWPAHFSAHHSTLPFLRRLNSIIHPEVRKLYVGAYCPHFDFCGESGNKLLIGYRSPRKLCRLAHGFIDGVGEHYNEKTALRHLECMHDGDPRCLIEVTIGR